jgi:hypothetical protein
MPLKIILLIVVAVVVLGSVCVVILWGSRWRQAAPVPADSLSYPCLRIIDGHAWERIDRPGDLDQINSNRFMNRREDPLVVDSSFRVFEMTEFNMKASGLGLMFTGPRRVDVSYKLILRPDKTVEHAESMVAELLKSAGWQPEGESGFLPNHAKLKDLIDVLESQSRDSNAGGPAGEGEASEGDSE